MELYLELHHLNRSDLRTLLIVDAMLFKQLHGEEVSDCAHHSEVKAIVLRNVRGREAAHAARIEEPADKKPEPTLEERACCGHAKFGACVDGKVDSAHACAHDAQ